MWFHILVYAGNLVVNPVLTAWYLPRPIWLVSLRMHMVTWLDGRFRLPAGLNHPHPPAAETSIACQLRRGSMWTLFCIFFPVRRGLFEAFSTFVGLVFSTTTMPGLFSYLSIQQGSFFPPLQKQETSKFILIFANRCVTDSFYFLTCNCSHDNPWSFFTVYFSFVFKSCVWVKDLLLTVAYFIWVIRIWLLRIRSRWAICLCPARCLVVIFYFSLQCWYTLSLFLHYVIAQSQYLFIS